MIRTATREYPFLGGGGGSTIECRLLQHSYLCRYVLFSTPTLSDSVDLAIK